MSAGVEGVNAEDELKRARAILDAQPFSRLLGAELVAYGGGRAEIALPLRGDHLQQHGFVHGGAIAYLADNTLAFAGGAALGDVLTAEFKINFMRPAAGVRLIARARALSAGKRHAVVLCEVCSVAEDGGETLCAAAQGSVRKI